MTIATTMIVLWMLGSIPIVIDWASMEVCECGKEQLLSCRRMGPPLQCPDETSEET